MANKNNQFIRFVNDKFKWVTLGVTSFIFIIWWSLFGMSMLYSDSMTAYKTVIGMEGRNDGWSLTILTRMLLWTQNSLLIIQILTWVLFVLTLWWAALTLDKIKTPRWIIWTLIFFYSLNPFYQFILEMNSRDQLMSIITLAFVIKLFQIIKSKNIKLKDYIILCALFVGDISLKETAILLGFLLVFLIIKFKSQWIKMSIVLVLSGVIFLLCSNLAPKYLDSTLSPKTKAHREQAQVKNEKNKVDKINTTKQATSFALPEDLKDENIPNLPLNLNQAAANIFLESSANISEEQRQYFTAHFGGSSSWFQSFNPNLQDQINSGLGGLEGDTNKALRHYFWPLCFNNFGTCMQGLFSVDMGFVLPKTLDDSIWKARFNTDRTVGTYLMPYYVWERANTDKDGDEMLNIQKGSWLTDTLCMDTQDNSIYPSDPSDTKYAFPIKQEDIKNCLAAWLEPQDVDSAYNSLKPYIRSEFWGNSLIPGLSSFIVNFWSDFLGGIFVDGFWFFWAMLILLIIAISRTPYRKLLPLPLVSTLIYLMYFLYAPTSYERYIFPMIAITPLIVAIFVREWMVTTKRFNPRKKV